MDIHIHLPHWILLALEIGGGVIAGIAIGIGLVYSAMALAVAKGLGW